MVENFDPVVAAVTVYDRTAEHYQSQWDGYVTPAMERLASSLAPNALVLDAGCGPGRDLQALVGAGLSPVGVDLSAAMCSLAATSGQPVFQGDLRYLPFADQTFDGVLASASLVHLDPDTVDAALCDLARVTRSGGVMAVSVKADVEGSGYSGFEGTGENQRWFYYWPPQVFVTHIRDCGWAVETLEVRADTFRPISWVETLLRRV